MLLGDSETPIKEFLNKYNVETCPEYIRDLVKVCLFLDTLNNQVAHAVKWVELNPEVTSAILLHTSSYTLGEYIYSAQISSAKRAQTLNENTEVLKSILTNLRDKAIGKIKDSEEETPDGICPMFGCPEGECDLCKSLGAETFEEVEKIEREAAEGNSSTFSLFTDDHLRALGVKFTRVEFPASESD